MAASRWNIEEYAYAQWAWFSPEEEKLPKPGDWEESAESLLEQGERWNKAEEQRERELIKDLETLDRIDAEKDNGEEKQ